VSLIFYKVPIPTSRFGSDRSPNGLRFDIVLEFILPSEPLTLIQYAQFT